MLLIPAIDLKDGKCVRLRQGRMDDNTVFSDDPVAVAERWAEAADGGDNSPRQCGIIVLPCWCHILCHPCYIPSDMEDYSILS